MEDTKALTGEAVPRKVSVGDEIISGCINLTNILKDSHYKGIRRVNCSKNP